MAATAHTHCCCGGPTPPAEFPCCSGPPQSIGSCGPQTAANCFASGGHIVSQCGPNGICLTSTQVGACLCNALDAAPTSILWFLNLPIRYYPVCLAYQPQQNWPLCNNVSTNNLRAALEVWLALAHLIPITTWRFGQPCAFSQLFPVSYPSGCTPGQTVNTGVAASGSVSFNFNNQCFITGGMSSSTGIGNVAPDPSIGTRPPTGCGCLVTKGQVRQNDQLQPVRIDQCPQNLGCINSNNPLPCYVDDDPQANVTASFVW